MNMTPELKDRKVTIVTTSEYLGNVIVWEGRLQNFGTSQWAQYSNAPFVDFIPSRKRKAVRVRKTYKPFLMVLDGVGHNLTPNDDVLVSEDENVRVTKKKYMSFDPRYVSEFMAELVSRNIKTLFSVVPDPEFA